MDNDGIDNDRMHSDGNHKIEMLNKLNHIVYELTEKIKNQCKQEDIIDNTNIENLETYVKKFIHSNTCEFKSSYSISWLKSINILLLNIVKNQDRRITVLEDKLSKII